MSAQQQALSQGLGFLVCHKQSVLRVTRGVIWGKVECLEIVVIGLDHRAVFNRISEIAEDRDDLIHRLDDWMFCTKGTMVAR